MRSLFNGVLYDIPQHEIEKLQDYIEKEWKPALEKGTWKETKDGGHYQRLPTNVRALSFTIFLQDWYRNNFEKYIIDITENDLVKK